MPSCARRDSRSGSELPPFVPCTAPWACQVPPSGTCCHRFTSWVGITPTRGSSCQEQKLLRLLPNFNENLVGSQRIARCGNTRNNLAHAQIRSVLAKELRDFQPSV